MGIKKDDWCLKKAFNDEKLFVLMARDITSPQVVGEWIKQNIGVQPRERLIEALDCAIAMVDTQKEISNRKEFQKLGWIFITSELPSYGSCCDVLYGNDYKTEEGVEDYFDAFTNSRAKDDLRVVAWKNPRRVV